MLLTVASFGIAALSLILAAITLIIGQPSDANAGIRRVIGVCFLLAAILFGFIGLFSFFGLDTRPPLTGEPSTIEDDCGKLIEGDHHNPTLGTSWSFGSSSEDRIIHIWSNHWDPNLPEYKLFLPAGRSISFLSGGGSYWSDRPGCSGVAQGIFRRDVFQEITFDQYQRYIEQGTIP